jgi:DNA (cytosine-5)-methyltransferase 1
MKVLDLFSGIGGFSLGLESTGHFKTVAFCDNDKFCKLILDKHWKGVKIYDDVKEISKKKFKEDNIEFPDIITGGFPCQPFSVAGKQQGTSDSRHLWPEMFRIIKDFAPRWVIGENVKGLTNIQDGVVFETVCSDLEGEGYEVRTFNIPAAGVQAPHRRERLWIVAHSKSERTRENNKGLWSGSSRISGGQGTSGTEDVVNPFSQYESEPIKGSNEEESRIQEEHRQKDSTTRESSRTGSVWGTNKGHEDMENSRRTLRQGSELQGENGNETKEGNADQSQRSSGTSRSNVANTEQIRSSSKSIGDIGSMEEESSREKERGNQPSICTSTRSTDVANTERQRLEGFSEHSTTISRQDQGTYTGDEGSRRENETMVDSSTGRCTPQETEVQPGRYSSFDSSWWQFEPELGRVAHGVSGRVHRLKALGNSIVPKIVQEIGNAIIQAEKEKDLEILDERNGM